MMFENVRRWALVIGLACAAVVLVPVPSDAARLVAAKLTDQDRADLKRIEDYLNGLRTLTAEFMQVAPDGGLAKGRFYLSRPGKMRFEYDPPVPILMIANGTFLVFNDASVNQTSYLPLDSTPVGLFVRDHIVLSGSVTVTRIERAPNVIRVSIRQTDDAEQGELTLVFSDRPLTLQQWTVLDTQNRTTRVALLDVRTGAPINPDLFRFEEPKRDDNAK